MQGIEFEDDRTYGGLSTKAQIPVGKPSWMLRMLYAMGISDKTTANFILLGVAMVLFGFAIFTYAGILGKSTPKAQDVQQIAAQLKALHEMQGIK